MSSQDKRKTIQLLAVKYFHGNTHPSVTPPYTKVRPSPLALHVTKQPSQRMYLQDRRKTKGCDHLIWPPRLTFGNRPRLRGQVRPILLRIHSREFARIHSRNRLQERIRISRKNPWQSTIKNNIWGSHKNVFKRDWLLDRQTLKKTTRLANPPWVLRKEVGTPYSYQLLNISMGTRLTSVTPYNQGSSKAHRPCM